MDLASSFFLGAVSEKHRVVQQTNVKGENLNNTKKNISSEPFPMPISGFKSAERFISEQFQSEFSSKDLEARRNELIEENDQLKREVSLLYSRGFTSL